MLLKEAPDLAEDECYGLGYWCTT